MNARKLIMNKILGGRGPKLEKGKTRCTEPECGKLKLKERKDNAQVEKRRGEKVMDACRKTARQRYASTMRVDFDDPYNGDRAWTGRSRAVPSGREKPAGAHACEQVACRQPRGTPDRSGKNNLGARQQGQRKPLLDGSTTEQRGAPAERDWRRSWTRPEKDLDWPPRLASALPCFGPIGFARNHRKRKHKKAG
jgi:hypothetical protein